MRMRLFPGNQAGARSECGLRRPRKARRRRSGLATLEFALVAPFLGFLVVGMFELSQAVMTKVLLSDAARKGCRVGVLPGGQLDSTKTGPTALSITQNIDNILNDNGIPLTNRVISVKVNGTTADPINAQPGDQVSANVQVPVSDVFWGTSFFLPLTTMESETILMMRQG
jgi:Flp pilus assembly protein TadG